MSNLGMLQEGEIDNIWIVSRSLNYVGHRYRMVLTSAIIGNHL